MRGMSETSDQANSPSEACCRARGTDLKPGNSDSLASSRFFQALSVIEPRTSNNELRTFPPNLESLTTAFLPLNFALLFGLRTPDSELSATRHCIVCLSPFP